MTEEAEARRWARGYCCLACSAGATVDSRVFVLHSASCWRHPISIAAGVAAGSSAAEPIIMEPDAQGGVLFGRTLPPVAHAHEEEVTPGAAADAAER